MEGCLNRAERSWKIGGQRSHKEVSKLHGDQTIMGFQVGGKSTSEQAGLAKVLDPVQGSECKAYPNDKYISFANRFKEEKGKSRTSS